MARFIFSKEHDGSQPPARVVRGTLYGKIASYDVKIVYEISGKVFAGPREKIQVPANGSIGVDIQINRCKDDDANDLRSADVLAQLKESSESNYVDSDGKTINYRCG